jgi:branched-chain amino acid transport system substrate-binding protein
VIVPEFEKLGVKVAADISTDQGQIDFSGPVLKAKQSNADALFVYLHEEESARILRELRSRDTTSRSSAENHARQREGARTGRRRRERHRRACRATADAPNPHAGVREEVRGRVQVPSPITMR